MSEKPCELAVSFFKKASEQKNARYMEHYKNREFDEIADMYHSDCRFMPAGFPIQMGTKGIAGFWQTVVGLGFHSLWLETQEICGPYGPLATERCTFVFKNEKGEKIQAGKYIMVWHKEDDEWKYFWECWNADPQPEANGE